MQPGHPVISSISLQIHPQAKIAFLNSPHPIRFDTIQPIFVKAIINPKQGMEEPLQLQTPQPPRSCSSPGPAGKSCWNLDLRVAVLLVTLAGVVILLLLYKLLQLRHRLGLARASHGLEYSSFYYRATYTLKPFTSVQDVPVKNGTAPEYTPPIQTVTAVTPAVITPVPPPPVPPQPILSLPTPALPLPAVHPTPSLPQTPRVLSLPLPLPVINTTPPSPHLSWGACSDVDVYSRIGAFRPSRLSSLSSQSTVILFEHSSL
ncbi:amyloid beta A4 precursor protein-binding family B member 1-interacting protein [Cololabis saira]|uniref:amyloid beta A4 precursor protein-binding family B member 1-interacting protein n=1 Tax=Cololabis saira TaxID=129043 RepID=UPI002AD4EA29|nr:amyloid beta A4 precursor protein-binding family B member 1-interacting protein [Cololabis saira]